MSMKFETGKTYCCHSLGDWDCVWKFTVTARTAKTVTITLTDGYSKGKAKRTKVYEASDGEYIYPLGRYSMQPILRAINEA